MYTLGLNGMTVASEAGHPAGVHIPIVYTAGIHITLLVGLSSIEAATMDERIKQMELEDIHHLITHEIQGVMEYKLLDNKAEEGQRGGTQSREAPANWLERQQHFLRSLRHQHLLHFLTSQNFSCINHCQCRYDRLTGFLPPPSSHPQPRRNHWSSRLRNLKGRLKQQNVDHQWH